MRAYERLLEYVSYATQSAPDRECHPSTPGQFDLARRLVGDLNELGLTDAAMDEHAYVYAHLAATPGCEQAAPLGLIAHMDTSDEAPGDGVAPQLHPNYDGGTVALGASGLSLRAEQFPDLRKCQGETLITTDGTTLLGADDKAGVARSSRPSSGFRPNICPMARCVWPLPRTRRSARVQACLTWSASARRLPIRWTAATWASWSTKTSTRRGPR